ncbi:MAG: PD-(D/E)XK nuclease-like domain-containing protein [Pseudomonadota bacterium]
MIVDDGTVQPHNFAPDESFQPIGAIADRVVKAAGADIRWDGETITEPGIYSGISLDHYHNKTDLLDGPSVSKSSLKYIGPGHSPKEFWHRWAYNPNRIEPKKSDALDFGKAVHCLLLGDQAFAENFVVRPDQWESWNKKASQEWRNEHEALGFTVLVPEQMDKIARMYEDAKEYPLIKGGILNGRVERSLIWKDPETQIWLKVRPDVIPLDGIYADLKTVGDMSQEFLERQIGPMGYYIQGALTRMGCRALGKPFESFVFLYSSTADTPDTAHAELSEFELDRGEHVVRHGLKLIRQGLDTGEWPGADICDFGSRKIQMKPWDKERIDRWIELQNQNEGEAA